MFSSLPSFLYVIIVRSKFFADICASCENVLIFQFWNCSKAAPKRIKENVHVQYFLGMNLLVDSAFIWPSVYSGLGARLIENQIENYGTCPHQSVSGNDATQCWFRVIDLNKIELFWYNIYTTTHLYICHFHKKWKKNKVLAHLSASWVCS